MTDQGSSRRHTGRSVEQQLRRRSNFASLLREAEAYLELNRRIGAAIPASARAEIGVARIVDGCVEIAAASPARATQARLAAQEILDAARQHWPGRLVSTRVIVTPGIRFGEG